MGILAGGGVDALSVLVGCASCVAASASVVGGDGGGDVVDGLDGLEVAASFTDFFSATTVADGLPSSFVVDCIVIGMDGCGGVGVGVGVGVCVFSIIGLG